jgi:hypothetical protein
MNSPGLKTLGTADLATINAATTATVVTSATDENGDTVGYLDGLEGMLGATLSASFAWGSGAGTLKVIFEITLNQGVTWIEVGRLAFAAASAEKALNITNGARLAAYTPADLADDTAIDGIMGDRFRARILKGGSPYAGATSLAIRLQAR